MPRPFQDFRAALKGEIERLLAQLQAVDAAEAAFQRLTDAFAVPDPRGLDPPMSGSPRLFLLGRSDPWSSIGWARRGK